MVGSRTLNFVLDQGASLMGLGFMLAGKCQLSLKFTKLWCGVEFRSDGCDGV